MTNGFNRGNFHSESRKFDLNGQYSHLFTQEVKNLEEEYLEAALSYLTGELKKDKMFYNMFIGFLGLIITAIGDHGFMEQLGIYTPLYWNGHLFVILSVMCLLRVNISPKYIIMGYQIELIKERLKKS